MTERELKKWEDYFRENRIKFIYYPDGILEEIGLKDEKRFGLSNFYLPEEGIVLETNASGNVILLTEIMIDKCKERGWRYCVPAGSGKPFEAVFFNRKKIKKSGKTVRYFVKWQEEAHEETEKIALVEADDLAEVVEYYPNVVELVNLTMLGLLPHEINGKHRYDELDDVELISDILSGEYPDKHRED